MIKCKCGGVTGVIHSGGADQREGHRRRKCKICDIRFTTYETREDEQRFLTLRQIEQLEIAMKDTVSTLFKRLKRRTHE